ncbi:hypothetical protein [Streptomyces sp. SS162]|uniref:hypothetical protein n=1 Tax=Streptomyces sp. SS162 TaxID=3108484 RepID=UPI002F406AD1
MPFSQQRSATSLEVSGVLIALSGIDPHHERRSLGRLVVHAARDRNRAEEFRPQQCGEFGVTEDFDLGGAESVGGLLPGGIGLGGAAHTGEEVGDLVVNVPVRCRLLSPGRAFLDDTAGPQQ